MATTTNRLANTHVAGSLTCDSFTAPDGSITNAAIKAGAAISASKLVHQFPITTELFGPAVSITALTKQLYIAYAAGNVIDARASLVTVATGADRTVTVDIKKSTAAGAYATIMTSTIGFTNASVALTPVAGSVNATNGAYLATDILEVVVTVAGAAGAQAIGLILSLTLTEAAAP